MDKIVAITNRKLCQNDFYVQIEYICKAGIKTIILREKDLSCEEYIKMATKIIEITRRYDVKLILHTYVEAARKLNHKCIHLSMDSYKKIWKV